MMEFVSWDDDIPNIWKVIKFMFQTTTQKPMVTWGSPIKPYISLQDLLLSSRQKLWNRFSHRALGRVVETFWIDA